MDVGELRNVFAVSEDCLREVAHNFASCMQRGLHGEKSPLKMLPSYLDVPSGCEQGRMLALDFGGTNVRCLDIELFGQGRWQVHHSLAKPLRDKTGTYDFTGNDTSAEVLFDFIASIIEQTAVPSANYLLGHTFSYPCRQASASEAILLAWTKELKVSGVVGQPINQLLTAALKRRGLSRIVPAAILNDTVGTLLTAGFFAPDFDIGSICGTGHNTCYREVDIGPPVIINMEAGNFNEFPDNPIDRVLDAHSDQPGAQRLEKIVGGRYLGEMVLTCLRDMAGIRPNPYARIDTAALAPVLADRSGELVAARQLLSLLDVGGSTVTAQFLQAAVSAVVERAARLAAATYYGVLLHIDPRLSGYHQIAVDGSLYEKMPSFAAQMAGVMGRLLEGSGAKARIRLVKEGSVIGAALAAAQYLKDR